MHFETNATTGHKFCLSQISMSNNGVRDLIEHSDALIDVCDFADNIDSKYKRCIKNYRRLIKIVRKNDGDYTDKELDDYDKYSNLWFQD